MVLKLVGEDIERSIHREQKECVWGRHNCFVGSSSVDKFLLEGLHLKKHDFGFMGDGCKEI